MAQQFNKVVRDAELDGYTVILYTTASKVQFELLRPRRVWNDDD